MGYPIEPGIYHGWIIDRPMEEPLTDSNKERRPMNDKNEYYAHQDSYAGRL